MPGFAAGILLGWDPVAAILLGGVTYISSSGVIAKLVGDLGRIGNRETPHVLTVLVLEDLVMAVYLPVVAVLLAGTSPGEGAFDVDGGPVGGGCSILVVLGRCGDSMSGLLTRNSGSVADEVVLLSVFGSVLLVAGLVQQVDVSAAVGAFLVGVAISGPAQHRAAAVIGPLRDLFAAIFFFAFALEVDTSALPPVLPAAAALAARRASSPSWRPAGTWPGGRVWGSTAGGGRVPPSSPGRVLHRDRRAGDRPGHRGRPGTAGRGLRAGPGDRRAAAGPPGQGPGVPAPATAAGTLALRHRARRGGPQPVTVGQPADSMSPSPPPSQTSRPASVMVAEAAAERLPLRQ